VRTIVGLMIGVINEIVEIPTSQSKGRFDSTLCLELFLSLFLP
jgi:hypothetical protein